MKYESSRWLIINDTIIYSAHFVISVSSHWLNAKGEKRFLRKNFLSNCLWSKFYKLSNSTKNKFNEKTFRRKRVPPAV